MENWCWEPEALAFISGHFETGEPLPKELLDKMLAAKTTVQRCLFCVNWSSVCLISVCTRSLTRSKAKIPSRRWRKLKTGRRGAGPNVGRFPHAFSHILLVATQRVTTAICGQTYWRLMPSLASKMKGIFNRQTGQSSRITSSPVAVLKSRWNCSSASVAASHSWMQCWSITGSKADYSRENLLSR